MLLCMTDLTADVAKMREELNTQNIKIQYLQSYIDILPNDIKNQNKNLQLLTSHTDNKFEKLNKLVKELFYAQVQEFRRKNRRQN